MKWTLVFCMIVPYCLVSGWTFLDRVVNHGQSCVFRNPGVEDRGTKNNYKPIPAWDETPLSLRPSWIINHTLVYMYFMIVTDMIGAMGCYAARHRLNHRRWFTAFLWLCALLFILRLVAAIPDWRARSPFLFFPPTLGAWLIFPLLMYERVFPTLPREDAEASPDEWQTTE